MNKHGIGPKFISFKDGSLVREFVDGERIGNYIKTHNKKEIINIIKQIFNQLLKMDELGINKFEMTNPYKHIIVRKNIPYLIDFERCRYTKQPKNITQFLQYLISGNVSEIFKKKKIKIDKDKIIQLSKDYKKTYDKKLIRNFLKSL